MSEATVSKSGIFLCGLSTSMKVRGEDHNEKSHPRPTSQLRYQWEFLIQLPNSNYYAKDIFLLLLLSNLYVVPPLPPFIYYGLERWINYGNSEVHVAHKAGIATRRFSYALSTGSLA